MDFLLDTEMLETSIHTVTCIHCGIAYPHTRENFYWQDKAAGKLHTSVCIQCTKARTAAIKLRKVAKLKYYENKQHVCWLEFKCSTCGGNFKHWFKAKGRAQCFPCETLNNPEKRANVEKRYTLDEYRAYRLKLAEAKYIRATTGLHVCMQCGGRFHKSAMAVNTTNGGILGSCIECHRTGERIRRQLDKAATRDGVADTIRKALKRNGSSPFVLRELGYTIADLRKHLERQFTDGMSWDAYMRGEIHIDHIKPKASFNFAVHSEWVECWSLSNLRPMWAVENMRKKAQILFLL